MAYRLNLHGLEVVCYQEYDFGPNFAETECTKIAYIPGLIFQKLIKIQESATIVVLLLGAKKYECGFKGILL